MSAHALSICLGPCVFPEAPSQDLVAATAWHSHANKALELMIAHCNAVFGDGDGATAAVAAAVTPVRARLIAARTRAQEARAQEVKAQETSRAQEAERAAAKT